MAPARLAPANLTERLYSTFSLTDPSNVDRVAMMKSGEIAKLYDKWFMQPIPPTNTRVGLPASDATKAAWASPNDKPVEEYLKK